MKSAYAIFDMDGTLVDSMGYWNTLGTEYLARRGFPPLPPELQEQSLAMTMQGSAELFIRTYRLTETPDQIISEINTVMEGHYRGDIPLKPGAVTCLERLKAAGVKMCIASSTRPDLIDVCLTRLGVRDYFEFLLSCEEVGVGKTRPDVYLEAARRLGGSQENTVVFEDILVAATTAKKAGFTLGVIYDVNSDSDQEKLKALADYHFTRWDDEGLLNWLGV